MILSALCPLLCNSTRPQHTLQMSADHCGPRQTIPWETINQGLLQPQGELYPIQTIFNHRSRDKLLEFRTSFYETISSEFLVQGNFKHTQFSREHWHWRDSNSQPLAPKASAVPIELTWLSVSRTVRLKLKCLADARTIGLCGIWHQFHVFDYTNYSTDSINFDFLLWSISIKHGGVWIPNLV